MLVLATALFLSTALPADRPLLTQAPAPIDITLKDGKVVDERTLRVKHHDEVILRVSSDRAITLHLHGYDLERTATPDAPAIFNFPARATGRFAIAEHVPNLANGAGKASHSHAPALLYLEVLPK